MALSQEGLIEVPGIRSEWVTLANGAKAHYSAAGDKGPPVILLHGGLPGSSGIAGWRLMMPFLAERGFRVFAPDRPGFGLADTREEYWPRRGLMSWVQFVEDFATALDLKQFHIGGNSAGAWVTAAYVCYFPERVKSFALIASGGINMSLGIDTSLLQPGIGIPSFTGTKQSMHDAMTSIIFRPEAISDDVLEMRTESAKRQQASFMAGIEAIQMMPKDPNRAHLIDLRGALDMLTIPGIYLYGRQDVLGPVVNAHLQEDRLPNIQFFYPDQCGHQGQTDQPEMHNQVFFEFFSTGRVSRATADWAGVSDRRDELPYLVEPR